MNLEPHLVNVARTRTAAGETVTMSVIQPYGSGVIRRLEKVGLRVEIKKETPMLGHSHLSFVVKGKGQ